MDFPFEPEKFLWKSSVGVLRERVFQMVGHFPKQPFSQFSRSGFIGMEKPATDLVAWPHGFAKVALSGSVNCRADPDDLIPLNSRLGHVLLSKNEYPCFHRLDARMSG